MATTAKRCGVGWLRRVWGGVTKDFLKLTKNGKGNQANGDKSGQSGVCERVQTLLSVQRRLQDKTPCVR